VLHIEDKICLPGNVSKPCEDIIGWGSDYLFAMDGASGLSGINIVDKESDAAWFVGRVKELLCDKLDKGSMLSTEEILTDIIKIVNKEYMEAAKIKGIEPPSDSPSAGIALFRYRNGLVEYFGLGDCTGIIGKTNGEIQVFKDTCLNSLDRNVLEEMARLHKETGISVIEARKKCNDMLLVNRKKRNKTDGYWILDLSGEGIVHARHAEIILNKDESLNVFVCSDGLAQLTETFGKYDNYAEMFRTVQHTSLEELCKTLFLLQEKDPDANDYPRFKFRDDTCCVHGKFINAL